MSKENRSAMETIEILSDAMRKGLSEYAIEGRDVDSRDIDFPELREWKG